MFLKILFRNFRDCFVVQLSKFVAAHQATYLVYQIPKYLSITFLLFLISYFQTTYESVLFRVVPADSLYIISPLPLSVNNFFTIISYLMNLFFTTLFYNNQLFIMSNVKRLIFFHFEKENQPHAVRLCIIL